MHICTGTLYMYLCAELGNTGASSLSHSMIGSLALGDVELHLKGMKTKKEREKRSHSMKIDSDSVYPYDILDVLPH